MSTTFLRPMSEIDRIHLRYWQNGAQALNPICGYVLVNKEDIPQLVAYLLPCPNGVAFIASIIASPFLSKDDRRKYLKTMVQYLLDQARSMGCVRVITTPTVDSLTRLFSDSGFTLYPRKADYLWKDL
jgi:hypothetical protein